MKFPVFNRLIIIGAIISGFALYKMVPFLLLTGYYTDYGSGYMIGNGILLFIGGILIFRGLTRKQNPLTNES